MRKLLQQRVVGGALLFAVLAGVFAPAATLFPAGAKTAYALTAYFCNDVVDKQMQCFKDMPSCTATKGQCRPYPFDQLKQKESQGISIPILTDAQVKEEAKRERSAQATVEKQKAESADKSPILQAIGWAVEQIVRVLFFIPAGLFMEGMAALMDHAIDLTINSDTYRRLAIIDTGWTVMRDFANLFFIFILLYIAIATILGIAGHNTMTMLRNVIITALLINFSLFFTQVVIDAGNIVAKGFYDSIVTKQGDQLVRGPSTAIKEGLSIQTIFNPSGGDTWERAMVWAGGAILMLITGYVFFAGAIMMIIRSVKLIFYMIFSPVAFVGFLLPKTSGHAKGWWDGLLKETMIAPAFLIMLYLNTRIIQNKDLFKATSTQQADGLAKFIGGDISAVGIIYSFIVLIGLMIASLKVAEAVAGGTASAATSWAKKGTGVMAGAAITGGAFAARQTIGRAGRMTMENERLKMMAEQGGIRGRIASTLRVMSDSAQRSSFDLRASKVGAAGLGATLGKAGINSGKAGGKGGYEATGGVMAHVSRAPLGIGAVTRVAGGGRVGWVGTDNQKALNERAEEMRKRGFSPEEIERHVYDRAGSTKTKHRRRIVGYETGADGNPDYNRPHYEIIGGNRVSGYRHPAFRTTRANVALDKVKRDLQQEEFNAQTQSYRAERASGDFIRRHQLLMRARAHELRAQRAANRVLAAKSRAKEAKRGEKSEEQRMLDALREWRDSSSSRPTTTPPAPTPTPAPTPSPTPTP